jgi:outer membrane protein assembly factor BamE (lipoprotein component of BamABCDE complex)
MNKRLILTSNSLKIFVCLILSHTNSSCIPYTKYSQGYADEKFASIKIGKTEKRVLEILGEPLTRWRPYQTKPLLSAKSG